MPVWAEAERRRTLRRLLQFGITDHVEVDFKGKLLPQKNVLMQMHANIT